MRAYKVLSNGRSEFTGYRWPLPDGATPGDWLSAAGRPELCLNGVHACTVEQLPQWLGAELWEVELDGEIIATDAALVASKARLLRQVTRWDHDAQGRFSSACLERAQELARGYPDAAELVGAVERLAGRGLVAACGYWTAVLAGERATGRRAGPEYDAAHARERSVQARWLQDELDL